MKGEQDHNAFPIMAFMAFNSPVQPDDKWWSQMVSVLKMGKTKVDWDWQTSGSKTNYNWARSNACLIFLLAKMAIEFCAIFSIWIMTSNLDWMKFGFYLQFFKKKYIRSLNGIPEKLSFKIEIGIGITISISNEDRDRNSDLNFWQSGSCLEVHAS